MQNHILQYNVPAKIKKIKKKKKQPGKYKPYCRFAVLTMLSKQPQKMCFEFTVNIVK